MKLSDILNPERIEVQADAPSKKRALELLSSKLAEGRKALSSTQVFDSLLARERLSSTGLGKGIALPHGRMGGIDQASCAFVQLREGIDFDSIDRRPVDLLCGLLVPEESTEEHLQILSALAEMLRDETFCKRLREASSREELYRLLTHYPLRPPKKGDRPPPH